METSSFTPPTSATSVSPPPPAPPQRAWQHKTEWEVLVENIAQSHARLASGIQLAIDKRWGHNFTGACSSSSFLDNRSSAFSPTDFGL